MAESISSLYIRLGISLDELTSDFISAERTVSENMNRLNREMQIIRLRTEIDLSGLDEATDASRRFQIQSVALNQLITAQRQRISLANAAYEDMRTRLGENSAATQRAQLALERERAALARLEEQLRNLNETQNETNESQQNLLESFSNFSGKFAPVIAGMTAVTGAILAAGTASRSLIEDWRELQKQSYELNMSVNDTENFLRHMRLAGGDIGDWEGFIRGITDAWVKGDVDDPETMALQRYGAQIEDATGKLKDFKDITEEVYQAYIKARDNGEAINFLQMLGGESGIRDAIQYLERYAEAKEDAAKIFDAGLNPSELHKAERELNLLDEQMKEFGDAIKNAIMPTSRAAIKELFELFHDGTEYITNAKDEIQKWQFVAIEAAKTTNEAFSGIFKPLADSEEISQSFDRTNVQLKEIYQTIDDLNNFDNSLWAKATDKFFGDLFGGLMKRAENAQEEYNKEIEETTRRTEELEAASKEMTDTLSYGLRDSLKRAQEFRDEIEDIDIDLNFDDGSIDKEYAKLDQWYERETRSMKKVTEEQKSQIEEMLQNEELSVEKRNQLQDLLSSKFKISREEETAINELYAKKREQIEQEAADRIEAIREEIANANRTDLENQIAQIEATKERRIQAGLPAIEAEKAAEQEKYKAIKQLEEEFADARDSIHQTELEKRLAQIEKEKQAWIQKGIDEVKATELAEQQKAEAARNAAMNVLKSQLKDYRAFRDGGYEALQQRMLAQLRKAGISDLDLQINPQQLQDFLSAQKNIQDNFLPNFKDFNESINSSLNEMAENVKNVNPSLDEAKDNLSEITEPLAEFKTNLSDMAAPVEDIKESFSAISESVIELPDLFNSLTESVLNLIDTIKTLPDINSQNESSSESLRGKESPITPDIDTSALQTIIDSVNTTISEARNSITQLNLSELINATNQAVSSINDTQGYIDIITSQMNEATSQLSQMMSTVSETKDSLSAVKDALDKVAEIKVSTPTVNITQNIDEPHAWDNDLIQELADKVADKMKNEIIYAIKNSYSY